MRAALLLSSLIAASACFVPFELEAELPNACVSKTEIAFGKPAPEETTTKAVVLPSEPITLRQRLEFPLDELTSLEQVGETSVVLNTLSLLATEGSFSSFEAVEISVVDPSQPDAGVVTLLRHELSGERTSVEMTPEDRIDLVPFARDGKLEVGVALTATAWPEPVMVDLAACFAVATRR